MWMVRDELIAKVLSQPGCSHLNGSTRDVSKVPRQDIIRKQSKLTLLGVSPLVGCKWRGFREGLIAYLTNIRLVADVRLQMPQDFLTRFELSSSCMTTCIPKTRVGVFTLSNMFIRKMSHERGRIGELAMGMTARPHAEEPLGLRRRGRGVGRRGRGGEDGDVMVVWFDWVDGSNDRCGSG